MVSEIGSDTMRRRVGAREARLEGLGVCAIALGAVAVVVFFVPGLDEFAWLPAVPAIILGWVDLGLKVDRRRYAIIGMMLGVTAFSWSVAMVLFGSAR